MTPEFNTFGAPLPQAGPRAESLGASEGSQKAYKAGVLGTCRADLSFGMPRPMRRKLYA